MDNNSLKLEKQELIFGPFITTNGKLALLGFDKSKLYLIKTHWLTDIKYGISMQLPLFLLTIDKLLTQSISELKEKHKIIEIEYSDIKNIQVVNSKIWRNYILINHGDEKTKCKILERHRTGEYKKIFEKLTDKTLTQNK